MAKPRYLNDEDDDDAFDERGVLKDGRTYRVPLRMMDDTDRVWISEMEAEMKRRQTNNKLHDGLGGSIGHKPGFVVADDAAGKKQRREAYTSYTRHLENAWRDDDANSRVIEQSASVADGKALDTRATAYEDYNDYITHCWRGPGR